MLGNIADIKFLSLVNLAGSSKIKRTNSFNWTRYICRVLLKDDVRTSDSFLIMKWLERSIIIPENSDSRKLCL